MGNPPTPQDAAPAYDDVVYNHPVNLHTPSGSTSSYAAIPQEDVELAIPAHNHAGSSSSPAPPDQSESLLETVAGVFRPKPHVHCEVCDRKALTEARERREHEMQCCSVVARVFIVAFVCAMVLGIVVVVNVTKHRKVKM